jgi:PhoD-like phosphatase
LGGGIYDFADCPHVYCLIVPYPLKLSPTLTFSLSGIGLFLSFLLGFPSTGNDSNGYSGFRDAALEAYRLAMPSYTPLPSNNSAYQAFTIGTVRFVISDLRSESTETSIYSKEQKEWLFQELSKSDQYDFVIWVTPKPWIEEETPGSDAWKGYAADRAELSQWISTQVTKKNILAISSDAHMLAFDDGSNTYYGDATTTETMKASSGPIESFPLLQSGPLDRLGSFKGGGCWWVVSFQCWKLGLILATVVLTNKFFLLPSISHLRRPLFGRLHHVSIRKEPPIQHRGIYPR